MEKTKKISSVFAVFAILLFVLIALAFYTFINAKGISYLSNSSEACNNCHIMNDVYVAYTKSSHSKKIKGEAVATCGDCHLPHDFVGKWIAKAQSGVAHAYAFTFKLNDLPTNLSANAKSKAIVQENCINCHAEMVSNVVNPTTNIHAKNNSLSCVSCHAGVGHSRGF